MRTDAYSIRTGNAEQSQDPTQYTPGELIPLYVKVLKEQFPARPRPAESPEATSRPNILGCCSTPCKRATTQRQKLARGRFRSRSPLDSGRRPIRPDAIERR